MPGRHTRKSLEFKPHKMRPRDSIAHAGHGSYTVSPDHSVKYTPSSQDPPKRIGKFGSRSEAIGAAQSHHASIGKGGEAYLPRPKTQWATPREGMSRMNYGVRSKKDTTARRRMGVKPLGTHTLSAKGLQLVSLDDYYASVAKADRKSELEDAPPKKFPRELSPAKLMKPVSDDEAIARLRKDRGARSKKSLRWLAALKALATGYSKVSGGGALKAANRGALPLLGPSGRPGGKSGGHYRSRSRSSRVNFGPDGRPGPRSDKANFGRKPSRAKAKATRLRRAMDVMSAPTGSAKPPKVYLPGVHNPKSPVRRAPGLKKPRLGGPPKPPAVAKPPTLAASLRPTTISRKAPRVLGAGGAAELSNSLGFIEPEVGVAKAEHGFKRGDLVVHNPGADSKASGAVGAVGNRSTGTHVHFKSPSGSSKMVHHDEVRAATREDVKYHQRNVDKLHSLGFTKGLRR